MGQLAPNSWRAICVVLFYRGEMTGSSTKPRRSKTRGRRCMTAPLGPKGASVVDGVDLAGIGPGAQSPARQRATSVVLASIVRRPGFRLSAPRCSRSGACSMCRSKAGCEPRCCCTRLAVPARPYPASSRSGRSAIRAPWGHDCRRRVRCVDRCSREMAQAIVVVLGAVERIEKPAEHVRDNVFAPVEEGR